MHSMLAQPWQSLSLSRAQAKTGWLVGSGLCDNPSMLEPRKAACLILHPLRSLPKPLFPHQAKECQR